jgi:hypothetical protein
MLYTIQPHWQTNAKIIPKELVQNYRGSKRYSLNICTENDKAEIQECIIFTKK